MANENIRNSNSLNEELKRREAAEDKAKASVEMKLDDANRVKVLSPGRLVAKRFFRNKLAIVGLCILIFMFIFSFIAPLFYPYGQTEVFYKYDSMLINYGLANERNEYISYLLDSSVSIASKVKNMMTSYITQMEKDGLTEMNVADDSGNPYVVEKLGERVYSLSIGEMEPVATLPAKKTVGQLNKITGDFSPASGYVAEEGFAEAAAKALGKNEMEFKFGGLMYAIEKGATKIAFNVCSEATGELVYAGEDLGEAFFNAFNEANAAGSKSFKFEGKNYNFVNTDDGLTAALKKDSTPVMVCTQYVFDAFETGRTFSDSFIGQALMALYDSRSFSDDGVSYKIVEEDGEYVIKSGDESVAQFSNVVVRRYDGTDTLSIDFKEKVGDVVQEMQASGSYETTFNFVLPALDEQGAYKRDENGNLEYSEEEVLVERKSNGYVLRVEQTTYLIDIYAPPSSAHPFGTDADGMDILARMMYGGRISLMVGFVVVILESALGILLGGIAGFFGGWVDTLIMRLVDIFYCIPTYPILIILGATFDALRLGSYQRLIWMMAVLGILGWAGMARLVRGQILSLREQEFMVAEEATGMKAAKRIFRHLVPNVMPQLIVSATMGLGSVIITESTLSFLGLGVKRPLATWGTMINAITSSNENLVRYAYIWIPVGLLICLTVIAFNFVGDGLRDAFDPKMKQ